MADSRRCSLINHQSVTETKENEVISAATAFAGHQEALRLAATIGAWSNIFQFLIVMFICTNCAVLVCLYDVHLLMVSSLALRHSVSTDSGLSYKKLEAMVCELKKKFVVHWFCHAGFGETGAKLIQAQRFKLSIQVLIKSGSSDACGKGSGLINS